jgi:type IV secretion system protein VirB4
MKRPVDLLKTAQRLSEFLPFAGFVADGIMATKNALLMRTFAVRPHDLTHANDDPIFNIVANLNNAFRRVAYDGWSIWTDSFRLAVRPYPRYFHPSAPGITKLFETNRTNLYPLYDTTLFITICKSIADTKVSLRRLRFGSTDEDEGIQFDLSDFIQITNDFGNMLKSSFKEVVYTNSDQMLTYLHATISDTYQDVLTPECPFYLDGYLADGIFVPDSICKYNDEYIVCATLHDFPGETHAGMASKINSIPIEFRFCTRWVFVSAENSKKEIKALRKSQYQKRRGIGGILQESVLKVGTALEDTDATSAAAESGIALSRLADGDVFYGRMATTIIVRDKDYDSAVRKIDYIKKTVNDLGFIAKTETLNTPAAFLGAIPGNLSFNARQPLISSPNFAHFFTFSVPWQGTYTNEHLHKLLDGQGEAPHIICKSDGSPFFLNLNRGDVGHTLVIGPTGSGKSTLLATLAVMWLKYPTTRVIFFDKDASSYHATVESGGTFIEISDEDNSPKLNPFSNLTDKAEIVFTSQLITDHLIHRGIPVSPTDETAIHEALVSLSSIKKDILDWTSFRNQIQDKEIRAALDPFVSGDYEHLFQSGPDIVQLANWLTFELGHLMQKGRYIVSFVLEYLFHRIASFLDGSPTLLVIDEGWVFLDNERFAKQLREDLKTFRKKNVYIIFATQEIEDAKNSAIFGTILNSCQTKILLPNHQARQPENSALYKSLGLTDGDIATLSEAVPKQDYYYFAPEGKQKFSLNLGPEELRLVRPRGSKKEIPS